MSDKKGLTLEGDTLAIIRGELERSPNLGSANTRRGYLAALRDFENWREGRPLTRALLEQYSDHLQAQGLALRTINFRLSAIRWWVRRKAELHAEGLDPEQQASIVAQAEQAARVSVVKGESRPTEHYVSEDEIRALLQTCTEDGAPAGTRDAAMIAVAFATGMRRTELCALQLEDTRTIEGGYEVTFREAARGHKVRYVAVLDGAALYLRDWLQMRGDRPGPLFLAVRKGGEIQGHGLGGQSLQEMLVRRAADAGVTDVHWEDIRRTLAAGIEETRREALRGLHVPYLRGGQGK